MEYSLWTSHDPHQRAYQVLLEPLAKDIARRLKLSPAHEATECLVCHTNPALARLPADTATHDLIRRERALGVGCESCHGNAAGWLDAHISEGWREKNSVEKRKHGLTSLDETASLVGSCTACHVGAPSQSPPRPPGERGRGEGHDIPARDVNHDLIAAGHPRLMFEASSYFANLPRHWKPKPRDEVQLWAVGQVVSAEAALALLHHRASSPDAPWPEFAEFDCAGCHHDLAQPSWRHARRSSKPEWGTWYFPMPRVLAHQRDPGDWTHISRLANIMGTLAPSRKLVNDELRLALTDMGRVRSHLQGWANKPSNRHVGVVLAHYSESRPSSWDFAEQVYLAFYALGHPEVGARTLNRHRELLTWPPKSEFNPRQIPRRFFPKDF